MPPHEQTTQDEHASDTHVTTPDETTADDTNQTVSTTPTECPECSGNLVKDEEHGEIACQDCGLIVSEDEIDRGPEWRSFEPSDRNEKSRVGSPTTELMHDKGLSTTIGKANRDAGGQALSAQQRAKMARLRTWDERARTKSAQERNLKHALGEIERMGAALGLPHNVEETAGVIYRRALDEGLLPGRSIEGTATAAVYAAARQAGVPRSLDEFEEVSRVDRLEISRTYRYLMRELGLEIQPADPAQYIPRFVSELWDDAEPETNSDAVEQQARTLLEHAKEEGIHSGKSPVGLAASAIYAAAILCDERVTQEEVSEATDVTEVTIRNRYRELLEAAGYVDEAF